jgi:hypothetical protein
VRSSGNTVFLVNDDEVWLERRAPHAPIEQTGPEASRTNRTGEDAYPRRKGRAADA